MRKAGKQGAGLHYIRSIYAPLFYFIRGNFCNSQIRKDHTYHDFRKKQIVKVLNLLNASCVYITQERPELSILLDLDSKAI